MKYWVVRAGNDGGHLYKPFEIMVADVNKHTYSIIRKEGIRREKKWQIQTVQSILPPQLTIEYHTIVPVTLREESLL